MGYKYKPKREEVQKENLEDLITQLKRVEDELLPLQAYRDTLKSQILDIMKDLDYEEYKNVYHVRETEVLSDFEKLMENHKSLIPYLVVKIDKSKTVSVMYNNHIDYNVARKMVSQAVSNTKVEERQHEYIKTKNS